MTLPSSGAISISQIAAEMHLPSNSSLRTLSAAAGFSTPDKFSDFYGYEFPRPYVLGSYLTNTGGYWSVDRGATWTKLDQTSFGSTYYRMMWGGDGNCLGQCVSRDGKYLGFLQGSHSSTCTIVRLYYSTDHGRTWSYQDWSNVGGFGWVQFSGSTGQYSYLMGWWGTDTDGKGYSTNYMSSYTLQNYTVQGTIGTFAGDDNNYAFGGLVNGGLHRSLDDGASWTENYRAWGGSHQGGHCDGSGRYIMVTRASTSGGTAQWSTDYGATHSAKAATNKVWVFAISNDASYCVFANCTDQTIEWSTNQMSSWNTINVTEIPSGLWRIKMHHGYDSGDRLYFMGYNMSNQKIYYLEPGDT